MRRGRFGGDGPLKGRKLLFQLGLGCSRFKAIRTAHRQYTEWIEKRERREGGKCRVVSRELYDLDRDPAMLRNKLAGRKRPPKARQLARALRRLARCRGIRGREPADVRPFCG